MNLLSDLKASLKGISLTDKETLLSYFGDYWNSAKPKHTGYVSACLNTMGNYFAKAKHRLYEVKNGEVTEVTDHPFLELLENPNPIHVENEIKHYMGEFFGVFGNYYLFKERGTMSGKVRSWKILDPSRITPKSSKTELISYYEYNLGTSKEKLRPEDVIHFKYLSSNSTISGRPLISAIGDILDIDAFQTAYIREFYENGGFLGQVFTTKQTMTPANFNRAKEELKKEYGGKGNSHKMALFDSGLEPIKSAYSLKDMEMTVQRKLTLSEVMTAFRIPKILLGGEGDTYVRATAHAAEYLYASTMIEPALSYADQVFTKNVRMDYGKKYKVMHDPISPKDIEENLLYYKGLASMGTLTINEVRKEENYDRLPYELADVPLLNLGGAAIRIDTGEQLGQVPNNKVSSEEESEEEKQITKDVTDLHWKQAERQISRQIPYIQRLVNVYFDDQRERLLKALDLKMPLAEFFFETQEELEITFNMVENAYMRMLERGMEFSGGLNVNDPRIRQILGQFLEQSKTINETSKKEISKVLKEGDPKENIEKKYNDFKVNRSPLIAQTTAASGFNAGLWLGYKGQGMTHKTWVSQRLPETRDSHLIADGQRIKIDDFFIVGTSYLMYPGDPSAPPEEVINCLCVIIGDK